MAKYNKNTGYIEIDEEEKKSLFSKPQKEIEQPIVTGEQFLSHDVSQSRSVSQSR